ncbi:MAG: glycosyltransferase [Verrucomicrobiota bacterium]
MSFVRNLFLVDQCLTGLTGHHLFYNRALAEAASCMGLQTTVVAGCEFRSNDLIPCDVRAVFRRDWRAIPPARAAKNHLVLNALDRLSFRRFRSDLGRAFPQKSWGPSDLVFGQMIAPRHLAAWLEWLSALPAHRAPALAVHVAYDPSRFAAHPRLKRSLRVFNESIHRARLIPLTDSSKLTGAYGEVLGRKVFVLPHVISPEIGKVDPFPDDHPPVFGVLGSPREEKGFAETVGAILNLSADPDPPRFLVVVNRPDAFSLPWVHKLRAARLENVELVEEAFESESDYARLFDRVSTLILPYHLNIYGVRTSGVFCEALASGRVVVVSEGSWMSDKAGDVAACRRSPERDPAALAAAIRSAIFERRELSAKARRAAPGYREEFSAQGFLSGLMEAVEAHV